MRSPVPVADASPEADIAVCRETLRANSKTFHAASLLLPARVRDPACVLYGFCRVADDEVDLHGGRSEAIASLRERVRRAHAGNPLPHATDRALAHVLVRHRIPREILDLLIEGLEWDADGRRYDTLEQLQAYAMRVAGTVGAMMSLLMGARSPQALARACDLGVAMQLTNIARDVGEDAHAGRLYLPRDWMRETGLDPDAWLAAPDFDARIAHVVQRLLDAADELYRQVDAGVAALPLDCRPGINAARLLYAEIGREIERHRLDSVSRRAVVPRRRKAALLARAAVSLAPSRRDQALPPLDATRPLVEIAAGQPWAPLPARRSRRPWRRLDERAAWVIDLFAELERRQAAQAPLRGS